jgi:hypothetical protein
VIRENSAQSVVLSAIAFLDSFAEALDRLPENIPITVLTKKRKLPSSRAMDGVEMLTVSTPFIAQLRSVALVVRDSNDNGGRA